MRRPVLLVIALVAAAAVALGVLYWKDAQAERAAEEERAREREAEAAARDEQRAEALRELREESAELIPDVLGDLALGMTRDELRAVRREVRPRIGGAPDPLGLTYMEEQLPNRSQVVYGLDTEGRLAQLQILSVLPSAGALEAHLTAMIETYGRPSGIWDCPDTGGVPTRRFTWRRAETALADILLIYGNRISQTLYIAPQGMIGASLRRAACRPVQSTAQLENFPVTTVEAIQQTQEPAPR